MSVNIICTLDNHGLCDNAELKCSCNCHDVPEKLTPKQSIEQLAFNLWVAYREVDISSDQITFLAVNLQNRGVEVDPEAFVKVVQAMSNDGWSLNGFWDAYNAAVQENNSSNN